jgi:hypothetical protein
VKRLERGDSGKIYCIVSLVVSEGVEEFLRVIRSFLEYLGNALILTDFVTGSRAGQEPY